MPKFQTGDRVELKREVVKHNWPAFKYGTLLHLKMNSLGVGHDHPGAHAGQNWAVRWDDYNYGEDPGNSHTVNEMAIQHEGPDENELNEAIASIMKAKP